MAEKTYTTVEAAQKADIGRATLYRWLDPPGISDEHGPIDATHKFPTANGFMRRWTDADIKRLKKYVEDHWYDMPVKQNRKKR